MADLLSIAGIATVGGPLGGRDRRPFPVAGGAGRGARLRRGAASPASTPSSPCRASPTRAAGQLRALAAEAGLDLGRALDLFDERTGFIAAQGVDLSRLVFRTAFARNLDYYTGFVFEAQGASPDGPVIGGGRYDRLAQALGSGRRDPGRGGLHLARSPRRGAASVSADRPFVLAVPSKGRLQENAFAFFARAGLELVQGGGSRDYRGRIAGVDGLEIAFLPVSEIVAGLGDGSAHLGVAGEDVLREAIPNTDGSGGVPHPARLRQRRRRGGGAAGLDRRPHHGRPRGRRGELPRPARPAHAGRHQIREPHAPPSSPRGA